jgi:glutamate racemase
MQTSQQLGIIDWGIGGIGIRKLIRERLGDIPVIYFSDTGVTPYGKMSRDELVRRLTAVRSFLLAKGVTHLVVGCNSASTAIPFLEAASMNIVGVVESAVRAVEKLHPSRLGLIGGRRTVLSGVYRRAFQQRRLEVVQRIAQPLSGLIEAGDVGSEELKEHCCRILSPLRRCSHILLACTHYPAISTLLKQYTSEETILIDPAAELVKQIGNWKPFDDGIDAVLTTGDPRQMRTAARNAFRVDLNGIRRVRI